MKLLALGEGIWYDESMTERGIDMPTTDRPCTEPDGNRMILVNDFGHRTPAHDICLDLQGLCPYCGEVAPDVDPPTFSSKVTP